MTTSYYLMKMSESKDYAKYYKSVQERDSRKHIKYLKQLCRICLKSGSISIYSKNAPFNIMETLSAVANVEIYESDYPKYLCSVCYQFLAIVHNFKATAKKTDEFLHQTNEYFFKGQTMHNQNKIDNSEQTNAKKEIKAKILPLPPMMTCKICNKQYKKCYFKEHMYTHNPESRQHVCEICGKAFRLKCSYYNHKIRHSAEYPFKCKLCPYKAKCKVQLLLHMRRHVGDFRYKCSDCPARYSVKSTLNRHIMLKHRTPEFKCDNCSKTFHMKLNLQQHIEADHLGLANHICNICGKAFGYRYSMLKHQRNVHKRKKMQPGLMIGYGENQGKDHNDFLQGINCQPNV